MNEKRSNQVINRYKQHKLNVSVLAQMKRILNGDENERKLERRFNFIGLFLAVALALLTVFLYSRLSVATI